MSINLNNSSDDFDIDDLFNERIREFDGGYFDLGMNTNLFDNYNSSTKPQLDQVEIKESVPSMPPIHKPTIVQKEQNKTIFEEVILLSSSHPPKYIYNPDQLVLRTKAINTIHTLEMIMKSNKDAHSNILRPVVEYLDKLAEQAGEKICHREQEEKREVIVLSDSERNGYMKISPAMQQMKSKLTMKSFQIDSSNMRSNKPENLFIDVFHELGVKTEIVSKAVDVKFKSGEISKEYSKITVNMIEGKIKTVFWESVFKRENEMNSLVFLYAVRCVSGRLFWALKKELPQKYVNAASNYRDILKVYKPEVKEGDLEPSFEMALDFDNHSERVKSDIRSRRTVDPFLLSRIPLIELKKTILEYSKHTKNLRDISINEIGKRSDSLYFEKELVPLVVCLSTYFQRSFPNHIYITRIKTDEGFESKITDFSSLTHVVHHPDYLGVLFTEGTQIITFFNKYESLGDIIDNIDKLDYYSDKLTTAGRDENDLHNFQESEHYNDYLNKRSKSNSNKSHVSKNNQRDRVTIKTIKKDVPPGVAAVEELDRKISSRGESADTIMKSFEKPNDDGPSEINVNIIEFQPISHHYAFKSARYNNYGGYKTEVKKEQIKEEVINDLDSLSASIKDDTTDLSSLSNILQNDDNLSRNRHFDPQHNSLDRSSVEICSEYSNIQTDLNNEVISIDCDGESQDLSPKNNEIEFETTRQNRAFKKIMVVSNPNRKRFTIDSSPIEVEADPEIATIELDDHNNR